MRVAVTLEQCWHRVPGGTATSALGSVRGLIADGTHTLVGVSARHLRPPVAAVRPPIEVRQLALPRPVLYDAWHRLGWPSIDTVTGPIDVIHATAMAVPPRSAPLVVTVHDLDFLDHPERATRRGLSFFRRALETAIERADIVVCPSTWTTEACIAHGFDAHRVTTVPWGADIPARPIKPDALESVRAAYRLPERYVLWVGTIEPRKNLATLLRAVAILEADVPLVIVGPDGWNEQLGDRIGQLGDRVRSLGFVPQRHLDAIYASATVFCYPSVAEGFGMPVLEAMAHGTPVVTSIDSAMGEIVGESGCAVLIDPLDPVAIAAAIDEVVADPARRDEMSRAAIVRAKHFSWSNTARLLDLAYRAAADETSVIARDPTGDPPGHSPSAPPVTVSRPANAVSRPNPMRVGINLLWLVPGVVGGSEDYTVRLLGAVLRRAPDDIDITLFVNRSFPPAHPDLVLAFRTVVAPVTGGSKWRRILAETTWLPVALARRHIELTHYAGGLVPLVHSRPNVETIHDLQPLAIPKNFSVAKRTYMRVWAPWSARVADRVITITEWVADDVAARAGVSSSRFRVVPHGPLVIEPSSNEMRRSIRARYGLGDEPFFLYPAITYPHKNHLMLVGAFRRVATVHQTARLVLTGGEASEEARVGEAIRASGLHDRILRTGRIPEDDLSVLFDMATALVFPSRYEGCGIPVLEAMSHGSPVLAASVGAVPETAGDGARFIDPDDPDAWSIAMVELLRSDDARQVLVDAGRRQVRARPGWADSADALLGVYRDVLGA